MENYKIAWEVLKEYIETVENLDKKKLIAKITWLEYRYGVGLGGEFIESFCPQKEIKETK